MVLQAFYIYLFFLPVSDIIFLEILVCIVRDFSDNY